MLVLGRDERTNLLGFLKKVFSVKKKTPSKFLRFSLYLNIMHVTGIELCPVSQVAGSSPLSTLTPCTHTEEMQVSEAYKDPGPEPLDVEGYY